MVGRSFELRRSVFNRVSLARFGNVVGYTDLRVALGLPVDSCTHVRSSLSVLLLLLLLPFLSPCRCIPLTLNFDSVGGRIDAEDGFAMYPLPDLSAGCVIMCLRWL